MRSRSRSATALSVACLVAACATSNRTDLLGRNAATDLEIYVANMPGAAHAHPAQVDARQIRAVLVGSGRFVESEIGPFVAAIAGAMNKLAPTQAIELSRGPATYVLWAERDDLVVAESHRGAPQTLARLPRPHEAPAADAPPPPPRKSEPTDTEKTATEEILIARGLYLRERGRDLEARAVFAEAYEQRSSPRALAQLGLADMALARWDLAEASLTQALHASGDEWIADKRAALQSALVDISRHVGSLRITTNVVGAEVRVNDREVGRAPLSADVRVNLGPAVIDVRAPGHRAYQARVTVTAGAPQVHRVDLVRSP